MPIQKRRFGNSETVAVYGASGHTGRFVISELLGRGLTPIAVGRNAAKLSSAGSGTDSVPSRTASINDPDSLDRAFAGTSAVINCAGPFLDTANAVAAAALRVGAHYLDVTAEQPSLQATFDGFDAAARSAGLVVVPAMGFYGGLADLLATVAVGDWPVVDEVQVAIALDSWHPTQGTRLTGERNTAARLTFDEGMLQPLQRAGSSLDVWDFAAPFGRQAVTELPFTEVVLAATHLPMARFHTYINDVPLHDLRDPNTPPPEASDGSGRSAQVFEVDVAATSGGRTRRIEAHGRDIYAFTAPLVCEAAERILRGAINDVGAAAPGQLFDAGDFLEALVPDSLELRITDYE